MSTATQTAPTNVPATTTPRQLPHTITAKDREALRYALECRLNDIRSLLPEKYRPDAARFVQRALFYFQTHEFLHGCTLASFGECVIGAAELGLAIDGKLAHAVPFNTNVAPKGQTAKWEKKATLIVDYKGLAAVGRRTGVIIDCNASVICANDHFRHGRTDDGNHLEHTWDVSKDRGNVIAVYARVLLPHGGWDYEILTTDQVEKIRSRSKAKDNGPWVTDWDEMAKKSVFRRLMKARIDDPGFARAVEVSDQEYIDGTDGMDTIKRLEALTNKLAIAQGAKAAIGYTEQATGVLKPERETEPARHVGTSEPVGTTSYVSSDEPDKGYQDGQPDDINQELQGGAGEPAIRELNLPEWQQQFDRCKSTSESLDVRGRMIGTHPNAVETAHKMHDATVERIKNSRGSRSNKPAQQQAFETSPQQD